MQLFGAASDQGAQDIVTLKWDLDLDGLFGETGAAATRGNENLVNPIYRAPSVSALSFFTVRLQATDDDFGSRIRPATINVFPLSTRLDFNAATNRTQAGFTGVRGNNLFNLTRGFGWVSAAAEFDNNESTELLRDGHRGTDNLFRIRVVPGALYNATLSFRHVLDHRGIDVFVEGVQRVTRLNVIGSSKQTDLVPAGFNFTVQVNLVVSSTDGILDFRFRGSGGNPFFIINGLQLVRR